MKKYRILALILAVLMVSTIFAGCGKKEPADTSDTTTSESTTTTETTPEITTTKLDLKGYNFQWINGSRNGLFYAEPANADQQAIMDAVHNIEDMYNCTFAENNLGYGSGLRTPFLATAMTGDKFADVIFAEQDVWGNAILQGYTRRLDTDAVRATGMDILDPAQFNSYVVNVAKVGDEYHAAAIYGANYGQQIGHVLCFNKALVTAIGYSANTIYKAVRDYDWTWDVLIDISKAGAVLNPETDQYDVSGIGHVFIQSAFPSICNDPIIYKDGKFVSGIDNVSFIAAYNTLTSRVFKDRAVHLTPPDGEKYGNSRRREAFYKSEVMFGSFYEMYQPFDNCQFEYGIVPYPHGSSSSKYASNMLYCAAGIIQIANKDWETTCFLFGEVGKALNNEAAGIEKLCTYVRDAESVEMFTDYILPNLTCSKVGFTAETGTAWNTITAAVDAGDAVMVAIDANKANFEAAVASAFKSFNIK